MKTPRRQSSATRASAAKAGTKRGHVQDEVAARLRHGLMVGAFIPGQVMSLRKLAAAFGTSPMPVRDALGQLVAANALEETPGRSVRVPRMTGERLKELFEIRESVEGIAARNACRKATPALLRQLTAINRELKAGIARREVLASLDANQRFHFALYRAAQSDVLMPLIESLWLQAGPTMYFSFLAPDMPWDASAHGEVLDALRRKDAAAAQRAIARDIRTTGRHLAAIGANPPAGGPMRSPMAELRIDL
jgi:DNA-binding GntR family transcriptional regulator